jgi:leucyl-tRNA synthetase
MYNHRIIEQKWIQKWAEGFVNYQVNNKSNAIKKYILVEFPFPSGAGLHVGHIRSYVAQDIKARMYRMQGQQVLYPIGWDAFGLPTENYAIQNNISPSIATAENIKNFKKQIAGLGLSFDWNREINTTDPKYYKWTQWIWLQMFKAGLAYQDTTQVWWCEELKTVLANEEVIDGKSERGGHPCMRVPLRQWMLAITKYADRLDKDLDTVDYLPLIKTQQRNWIGRSEGVQIDFKLVDKTEKYLIFDFDGMLGDTEKETVQAIMEISQIDESEALKENFNYLSKKPSHARGAEDSEIKRIDAWTLKFGEILAKLEPKIFNGFIDEIAKLQNIKIAIVSSGSHAYITPMIEEIKKLGVNPTHVLTYEDHHSKEEKIEMICNDWGVSEKDIYYFTDSQADIYELENLCDKNKLIGCGWGHMGLQPLLDLLPEKQVLKSFRDINNIFSQENIEVFTTRIDTIFGVTFLVVAPEHPLLDKIITADYKNQVKQYQEQTKSKSDLDRQQSKEKTGVFTGAYAIHPITGKNIPIWTADYVLASYGTGAIMAVPAHDERDKEFANKYNLAIINVITENNILENSNQYNGLDIQEAKKSIIEVLESKNTAQKKVQYKLRDWVFSRQRYWGEPFPIVWISEDNYNKISGEIAKSLPNQPVKRELREDIVQYAVPIAITDLPLELPEVESYIPQGLGEGPLAQTKDWVEVWYNLSTGQTISRQNPKPDENWIEGLRETDTMPNWAGSSWYYLRYVDPNNEEKLADIELLKEWLPVDLYNGGMEQVTVHLLYSRFWHKFLYDIGVVPTTEPYQTRIKHGMILAEGGEKMSKSKGNTVDPVEMVESFGADSLRVYEMFMGPYDEAIAWDTKGLIGCSRFLKKVYQWVEDIKIQKLQLNKDTNKLDYDTNHLIKKITNDIDNQKYNTCISSFMEYLNLYNTQNIGLDNIKIYIQLLAPFAPHLAEELWEILGDTSSIHQSQWPKYDETKLVQSQLNYQIHINGKMRDIITVSADIDEKSIQTQALNSEKVKHILADNTPKKIIVNQDKNIIIIIL